MTTYYTSYVNHILRLYTRKGNIAEIRTDADRLNWEAADRVLRTLTDTQRAVIHCIYAESMYYSGNEAFERSVNLAAERTGMSRNDIYILVSRVTRTIAAKRGLI